MERLSKLENIMIDRAKMNEYLVQGYCRPTRFKGFVWDNMHLFSDELISTLMKFGITGDGGWQRVN